jgi:hypothetical protein
LIHPRICRIISRTLKGETGEEANLKFCKVMAVQMLLYGSETWMFEEERRIEFKQQ